MFKQVFDAKIKKCHCISELHCMHIGIYMRRNISMKRSCKRKQPRRRTVTSEAESTGSGAEAAAGARQHCPLVEKPWVSLKKNTKISKLKKLSNHMFRLKWYTKQYNFYH